MMQIVIRDLVFMGCHGVNEHEKSTPQPFRVSINLTLDANRAIATDDVDDTINWSQVRKMIKGVVETRSFNLVERLASDILNAVLEEPRILQAAVTVEKPEAWKDRNGIPSIIMTRVQISHP